jgi:hypothetical protein
MVCPKTHTEVKKTMRKLAKELQLLRRKHYKRKQKREQLRREVTRVNSTNILDEGLRIGEVGRRMNSKVNQSNKVCIESKHGDELGLLSICSSPSSPGPYI